MDGRLSAMRRLAPVGASAECMFVRAGVVGACIYYVCLYSGMVQWG